MIRSSFWWSNWIMWISKSFSRYSWWILCLYWAKQMRVQIQTMLHPFCVISVINLIITRGQQGIFTLIVKGSSQFLPYWQLAQNLVPAGFCVTLQVIWDIIYQLVSWAVWVANRGSCLYGTRAHFHYPKGWAPKPMCVGWTTTLQGQTSFHTLSWPFPDLEHRVE